MNDIENTGWGKGVDYSKSKYAMNKMFDIRVKERIPAKRTKDTIVKQLEKVINGGDQEHVIKFLKKELIDARLDIEDLTYALTGTEIKHKTITCCMEKSDIANFFEFGEADQKLMAHLYWEYLDIDMRNVFMDKHFMNDIKHIEKSIEERMADPTKMRSYFLKNASPVLNDMMNIAQGNSSKTSDGYAFKEVWEVLKGIITSANDVPPLMDLRGKDISTQIDEILSNVSEGKITFDQAKEYMSLVSSGYNLQELPKLMAVLEAIESK